MSSEDTEPESVTAYSPTTHQTYTLNCESSEDVVHCTTGDARVSFDQPSQPTSSPPSGSSPEEADGESSSEGGEQDEVGSSSHATDAQFCQEHDCIGNFESEPGTIVECEDGSFSHAGGISGACSDHGGEKE